MFFNGFEYLMKNCLNYAYLKYIIAKRYNIKNLEKFREGKFFPKFLSSKNIARSFHLHFTRIREY